MLTIAHNAPAGNMPMTKIHEVSADGSFDIATQPPHQPEILDTAQSHKKLEPEANASNHSRSSVESNSKNAAAHTYDHGYARWEAFDEETELKEVPVSKSSSPCKKKGNKEEEIDFSLPLFESLPADQRENVSRLLALSEKQIESLPAAQAETVRSYREVYRQQLAIKRRPPECASGRKKVEPHEQLHAEMQKLAQWCSFAEANERWRRVEALDADAEFGRRRAYEAERRDRVNRAFAETVQCDLSKVKAAAKQVNRSQKKKTSKEKAVRATDRQEQFRSIRQLAASGQALADMG